MAKHEQVEVYNDISDEEFRNIIYPKRSPALIRGTDIGECRRKWEPDYLCDKMSDCEVKVHASNVPLLDFVSKNFSYKTMSFRELVTNASSNTAHTFYYLRSLGRDPRGREVADIKVQFPSIADDLKVPHFFDKDDFFSSVFRIASARTQLWTHYDVMDNILIQVKGRKRMVLFSPQDALNMYMTGDKSMVLDIDNPDLNLYPKFSKVLWYECVMEPGDILFIPALWFHNALALDFGVAVNIFWKHLPQELYDKNDPYGNKDPLPAAKALLMVTNALKALNQLPDEYKDFYSRRIISSVEKHLIQNNPE